MLGLLHNLHNIYICIYVYIYIYMYICIYAYTVYVYTYTYTYVYIYIYKVRLPQFNNSFIHPIITCNRQQKLCVKALGGSSRIRRRRQHIVRIALPCLWAVAIKVLLDDLRDLRGHGGGSRLRDEPTIQMSHNAKVLIKKKKYVCSSNMCFRIWLTEHELGNYRKFKGLQKGF